ncbi:MAG: DUF721 domain-containing protein [Pirellulales bacterium]|jgi:hypothetical protein|nr:DUF721 domain-containing protein [Pirellulales bacterium]
MSGRTRHRDRGRRREDGDQRPAGSGGPRPIGNVVSGLMARFGYDREQAASQLESAWSEVVPEMLRSGSRAGLVRRGVLEVVVTHSALAQEMGFHKREVVTRLQQLVPSEGITDIRCRVGTLS